MRRAEDVPLIAHASYDPETRRRLNDEPLTPDRRRESVSRAEKQWRMGTGAPFVIADAADDRPLGLLNLQFGDDEEAAGLAVSVRKREDAVSLHRPCDSGRPGPCAS
jgi:RimJ/RimL family protein N-acetyltransferase